MNGIEQYIPQISAFLSGLGNKCIYDAVKKWKELADQAKSEKEKILLKEHEIAKSFSSKIQQRITVSIRNLRLSEEEFEKILSLETNEILKNEFAAQFLEANITAESIVLLFIEQEPALQSIQEQLLILANSWLEEIEKAVAEDSALSNVLNFRAGRAIRSDIKSIGNQIAKAEIRDVLHEEIDRQRYETYMAEIADLKACVMMRISPDAGSSIPDHLQDQNQRRFERAKKNFLEGSIETARNEFAGLVEDLEALGTSANPELLLRSYLNLASALWELNKHGEASTYFDKAFARSPNDWRAKRGKGYAHIFRAELSKALQTFHEVRQARPDDVDNVCHEAWILKISGQIQKAIDLLKSHPVEDCKYFAMLSFTYLQANRYPDAEKAARKAIQLDQNSEVALTALSYALAFPIIDRRIKKETLHFVPTNKERPIISEAINHAEKAATSLRQHMRFYSLGEVLTNLTACYAAVGDCEKAIACANEALIHSPHDFANLTNLYCIQMRLGRFSDAANTACRLEATDPIGGWHKRAEALVLSEKSQEVLDSWERKKGDNAFAQNSDILGVVARAFMKRHRTDEGLEILTTALNLAPANPVLLSERGLLLETIGKIDEAKIVLLKAEIVATDVCRAQVLADLGLFFYRRHDWKEAAERFKKLDGESIHNPFFGNYLICLFNQGEYRQSLSLAEAAIKECDTFVEDAYTIAARCYHICENLPRAKELLDVLVEKGGGRELEHRKLLAWVYWKMDELPLAHDVLLKGLKLNSNDLDSLILMSAVCSALGKHKEALEHEIQATNVVPDSVRSHTALMRAAFGYPQEPNPEEAHRAAVYRSVEFLQAHDPRILRAVPVEPDFHSILEMLKNRSQEVQQFVEYFQNHKFPMGLFSTGVGCSMFEVWRILLTHPKLKIRMAFGTNEEQQSEIATGKASESVSVDLFALFTLQHLHLLRFLPKMFRRTYAHSSLLDAVVGDLREIQRNPTQGSIAYLDGKLVHDQRTLEQAHVIEEFLTHIRDFLKSPSVELVGLLPETMSSGNSGLFVQKCGMAAIAPLLVAQEMCITCFSDDAVLRGVGRIENRIPGLCTQAFLRLALERGIITGTEYQDALIKLIESNYTFISEDAGTLWRAYEKAAGSFTPLTRALINRVNTGEYDTKSCLPILAVFAVYVWTNKLRGQGNSREEWLGEVWQAISKAKNSQRLILEFVAHLSVACSWQPAVFAGIVCSAIVQVPVLRFHRVGLYLMMQKAIRTMSLVAEKNIPFSTDLSDAWVTQEKLNQLLERQRFLKLHINEGVSLDKGRGQILRGRGGRNRGKGKCRRHK